MVEPSHIRIGNIFLIDGVIKPLKSANFVNGKLRTPEQLEHLSITKEMLKYNFGFTVTDMGDYWQCELEAFVMIQPKFQFGKFEMPYIYGYKTFEPKSYKFQHVHQLQNVYYFIEQKELIWKPSKAM